jgi:uncharacterized damage-inducible protein DinB
MKKDEFLQDIKEKLAQIDEALNNFTAKDEAVLSLRPGQDQWNALECIEHLHRYNEFYIPEFQKSLRRAKLSSSNEMKRGSFGMKSAKSMLPKEAGVDNPMKTFKSKNSLHSNVSKEVLDTFRKEQAEIKAIVDASDLHDIGAVKCKTTLPIIRFRLCDALEFVINHQVRHIAQATRAMDEVLLQTGQQK